VECTKGGRSVRRNPFSTGLGILLPRDGRGRMRGRETSLTVPPQAWSTTSLKVIPLSMTGGYPRCSLYRQGHAGTSDLDIHRRSASDLLPEAFRTILPPCARRSPISACATTSGYAALSRPEILTSVVWYRSFGHRPCGRTSSAGRPGHYMSAVWKGRAS